jgi:hypothetical protein
MTIAWDHRSRGCLHYALAMTRKYLKVSALAVAGIGAIFLLSGCSASSHTSIVPSTPLEYLRGHWACNQNTDPALKGSPVSKWVFDISKTKITVSSPRSPVPATEDYVFNQGTLTLSDDGRGRLQQGYKNPATAQFPDNMPARGTAYNTAILLPNGDKWGLKITVDGDKATIKVAQPEDETWECIRG